MSNKPQILPWDSDAVIQWPSGMVARFDGAFWHQDGKMYTHRQFQREIQGVPFVRLVPMTTTETDAFEMGKESALRRLESATYNVVRAWTNKGNVPTYHEQQQTRLRHNWGTLYEALLNLVAASGKVKE